jgi:hypothetical protein
VAATTADTSGSGSVGFEPYSDGRAARAPAAPQSRDRLGRGGRPAPPPSRSDRSVVSRNATSGVAGQAVHLVEHLVAQGVVLPRRKSRDSAIRSSRTISAGCTSRASAHACWMYCGAHAGQKLTTVRSTPGPTATQAQSTRTQRERAELCGARRDLAQRLVFPALAADADDPSSAREVVGLLDRLVPVGQPPAARPGRPRGVPRAAPRGRSAPPPARSRARAARRPGTSGGSRRARRRSCQTTTAGNR